MNSCDYVKVTNAVYLKCLTLMEILGIIKEVVIHFYLFLLNTTEITINGRRFRI
ncbi:hypothetical protein SAMN03159341_11112 [Paenibacillus sp. 1_12]|nr:hypothetical protein SAMN03159341_11112 [Paenibacillus sp. 1_12]